VNQSAGVAKLVDGFLGQAVEQEPVVGGQAVAGIVQPVGRHHRGAAVELRLAEDVGENGNEQIHACDAKDAILASRDSASRLASSSVELYWPRELSKASSGSKRRGRTVTVAAKARLIAR
jgi:hypothetical protein